MQKIDVLLVMLYYLGNFTRTWTLAMQNCPNCAEELPDKAVRCPKCGRFLVHPKTKVVSGA